ncbi:MAG TPA: CoA pyrophosphatase [Vicinamibacterales bacterium]|nr:CoA pyrophosphatase [Vicinamibacterales bacterium]
MSLTAHGAELKALETFLADRLARALPGAAAQWKFAPTPPLKNWEPDKPAPDARQAAALILLYPGEHGPSFALTMRRHDLPHHPGQISLPGGRLDPGERAVDGALREAHEEIGIDPRDVRIAGALSPLWVVVSNFALQPFVGFIDYRPEFRASPREVSALIETPIASLLDTTRASSEERLRGGIPVTFPYFDFGGHRIWGATAMILSELREVLVR